MATKQHFILAIIGLCFIPIGSILAGGNVWLSLASFPFVLFIAISIAHEPKKEPLELLDHALVYKRTIPYTDIRKIDIHFNSRRRKSAPTLRTTDILVFTKQNKIIRLDERYQDQYWALFESAKRNNPDVIMPHVLPPSEEKLHDIIDGWREDSPYHVKLVRDMMLLEQAIEHDAGPLETKFLLFVYGTLTILFVFIFAICVSFVANLVFN